MNLGPTEDAQVKDRIRDALKRRLSPYLHEFKELLLNPLYLFREVAIVRREQPDIIMFRTQHLNASCLGVAKWTGTPLVLEVDNPTLESTLYLDQYLHIPFLGEFFERLLLRGGAEVIVVSEALRSYFENRHDINIENITANHNGVDCDKFHPGISGSSIRDRFGLQGKNIIGFVGNLYRWRGPDLLIEIISRLAHRQDVVFLLVGDGDEWKEFRNQLSSLNLEDSVVLAGQVDHDILPQYLAVMDLALLPDAAFYGSPLKLFEYMATGIPPVAPRYYVIEEIISHGETGLLFQPADSEAAAQHITSLLSDPEK